MPFDTRRYSLIYSAYESAAAAKRRLEQDKNAQLEFGWILIDKHMNDLNKI